jgi:3'-5' exoribonuclease
MDQLLVADFQKSMRFEGYLLVRSSEQRTSNAGGTYLDMTLADKTAEINAKVWNTQAAAPPVGSVLKLRAAVIEYNGRLQLRVEKYRQTRPEDRVDLSALVASASEQPETMKQAIDDAIAGMTNPTLRALTEALVASAGDKLLYYPAAQRMHHAVRSGLLEHMTSMLRVADAILPCYPYLDGDLVRAGIILHDLSKLEEMQSDELGNVRDYTKDGLLIGHLVRGVTRVAETAKALGLDPDDEYVLLVQHMIISHHGLAEYGSPRPPMFPEAEMLHWIDVVDARMNEMTGVLRRVPQGVFSEKIWSLDRRLYHPKYSGEEPSAGGEDMPYDQEGGLDPDAAYDGLL